VSTRSCSVLAEHAGDDLAATAPAADRFLLLEQPGPWRDRNAVTHSDLDVRVARELLARADAAGVKVHLIRRSSRRADPRPRTCFLAFTGRDDPWIDRYELDDPADVLELDLGGDRGARWDEPLYAVCTHGKRDPCCARRGRPLARALKAARPSETWEIGHIGGHRYAATLLAFPHGLSFGRVPAAAGPAIVAALEGGEIAVEHLRGRAGDHWAVQAADVLARRELGLRGLDALGVERLDARGDQASVRLRSADGTGWEAAVRRTIAGERPLSCGAEAEPVAAYELAGLVARDRAA
jgi:Sucrase/ferredoxin-like